MICATFERFPLASSVTAHLVVDGSAIRILGVYGQDYFGGWRNKLSQSAHRKLPILRPVLAK